MNLVIGNTSQLSYYFPEDYIKISSRKIDFDYITKNNWDSVYICFAEQRIYDKNIDYFKVNYYYTLNIIEKLINNSKKIVIYTSCELWNNYNGTITLNLTPSFKPSQNEYALSKYSLMTEIISRRNKNKDYNKVVIIHPFNFNSIHRKDYFLFGKIYDSIINKKQIEIGDTYFYRDISHTKYIVRRSIECEKDSLVGSGRLIFVNDFIRDIYKHFKLDYNTLVKENINKEYRKINLYYAFNEEPYTSLLEDTIYEIELKINSIQSIF